MTKNKNCRITILYNFWAVGFCISPLNQSHKFKLPEVQMVTLRLWSQRLEVQIFGQSNRSCKRADIANASLQQSCKRADKFRPDPGPNPKINLKPKSCLKNPKVELGLKNSAIVPSYFDYFFVHLRQKVRLRPKLSPTFWSTLGPNPNPTRKARPDLQLCTAVPKLTLRRF